MRFILPIIATLPLLLSTGQPASAQGGGRLAGTVSRQETGTPIHGASVLVLELGRSAITDDHGTYAFAGVPPGTYHVVAHLDHLFTEPGKTVAVAAGETSKLDFLLSLTADRFEITVTAAAKEETLLEAFQDVESFDAYELAESSAVSLGEALDHRVGTGIAKRSFGPGSACPIVRGFDGDRVLVMEDGIRTGTLSSQSGDHGEIFGVAQLERLEVVKGPSMLLYSGNAVGGTVNAVSRHHELHRRPRQGLRGFLSGSGGSTNALGGGSAGLEYGIGKVQFWGHGGGVRTGDYSAPGVGTVFNSRTELVNTGGGIGWYGDRFFLSAEARRDRAEYGVPFAHEFHGHHGDEDRDDDGHGDEDDHGDDDHGDDDHGDEDEDRDDHGHHGEEIERIALQARRDSYRVNWGARGLRGPFESFQLKLSYVDWEHDEIEHFEDGDSAIGTSFRNDRIVYRGELEQNRKGPLSGRLGFWGLDRNYSAAGEEALSPPVAGTGFAVFGLEEVDFERFKLQFGGRLETRRYRPSFSERGAGHDHGEEGHEEEEGGHADGHAAPDAIERAFSGASAAIGIHADAWRGGAFVAHFAHSYRAPALEELYFFGPHAGTRTFDIGDPLLDAERGNGFDASLRHRQDRLRAELNFFYYGFEDFIFPFATGEEADGLLEIAYTQRDARFAGTEANLDVGLRRGLWLNLGMDYVDAKDPDSGTHLPRIPPLRGKVGLEFRKGGLRVAPALILAGSQTRTFTEETPTAGYALMDLKASYTYGQQRLAHQFSVNVFNLGDRLYRNHSSYIKDLAPEIGRGVRFTYMVRFF